jgi:D-aminoacyl-tRNA deacylase
LIALIQRVTQASVIADGSLVGEIGSGLLALICAERNDSEARMQQLIERLFVYRVFPDSHGKMNLALKDVGGGLLLVPQFTLAADTKSGTRPSFTPAAPPELARNLFAQSVEFARKAAKFHETDNFSVENNRKIIISTGVFGADMKVHLVNDGPVTFWLQT